MHPTQLRRDATKVKPHPDYVSIGASPAIAVLMWTLIKLETCKKSTMD